MRTRIHVALLAAASLAACGKSAEDVSAELGAKAVAAMAEAKKAGDPWKAHEQLAGVLNTLTAQASCGRNFVSGMPECKGVPAATEAAVRAELVRYEGEAVKKGEPAAIEAAYNAAASGRDYDEASKRLPEYAPAMLAAAERAQGTPQDAGVLYVAGLLVAGGKVTMRDSGRAVAFLARAWAAGRPQAANDAAMHFLSINDQRNAYLWSLRCTAPCARSSDVDLQRLQNALQPAAAKQAQAAASDAAVVELDVQS